MKIIVHWLLLAAVVFGLTYFLPITVHPFWVAFIISACLIFINFIVKPILNVLTFPINFLTMGLFSAVLNIFLFYLLSRVVNGFVLNGWQAIVLGGLIVAAANWIIKKILGDD